ncbi:unnamed protein product [Rotaria sordida]|uniref:ABC transporter domain-containing protein n=1 Tax=Rotaria sordida TaxID=392033 RepID=A0A816DGK0_9BILA|nr:unnamed protein product [Rotaria sordida]CAF1471078.1 unnamed protein product [Rotaria sordida]CAF1633832.1 unnamed protein product [Rotaria sordida]CAF4104795.1 unnamed protein product [Rotaria sordida]
MPILYLGKYETLVGERGIQLSGGEKQRIALARALVKQPVILLLDEATSALDSVSEKVVQEALDRACRGRTTIVIAHRLTTIHKAHQIYVLDNGAVIEHGTHKRLMAKEGGKYQAMIKCQQTGKNDDDKDDMINIQKAIEEDEKSIVEHSRLLGDSEIAKMNEQNSKPLTRRFVLLRLLSMNSPEWMTILIGCIASGLFGGAQTLFAFLLAKIVNAFKYCSTSEQRHQVLISSLLFLLLGVAVLILRLFQLLDGVDIRQLNLHWVRSQIGLVSQEPILFDLTIAENITYGLENVSMEDIVNAARRANIHQFIEQLPQGYKTRVGLKGSFLSGGEKQRIAIARVLVRRPKILLLDEATSALDSHNEQIVQDTLEKAQTEDPNRTLLIVAHRLSTIHSCDLICVLNNRHIVESGTHSQLIQRRGTYYKMLTQNKLE